MALIPQLCILESANASLLSINDNTGVYSASNVGGFGTPNPDSDTITSASITFAFDKIVGTTILNFIIDTNVIQSVSKILRFGFDSSYPFQDSATTKECLEMETGQLLCMIDILMEQGVLDTSNVEQARQHKRLKLKEWSSIFDATN